jgi:hypothetical protein
MLFVQAPRLHSDEYTEKHVVKCNVYVGHIREEYYGRVCLCMCLTLGKYKKNGRFPPILYESIQLQKYVQVRVIADIPNEFDE